MAEPKQTHRYDDIIHMRHPISVRHAAMSHGDRAAQFAPFAALTGYEEEISETARLTGSRIELEENVLQELDRNFQYLQAHLREHLRVTVTYFVPDKRKAGGRYHSVTGEVKKLDTCDRYVLFTSGEKIPLDDILDMMICEEKSPETQFGD